MTRKERTKVATTARQYAKEWLKTHPIVSQPLQKKADAHAK